MRRLRGRTLETTKVWELRRLERLGSVDQVRQVELRDVVADNEIGVDLLDKVAPLDEQVSLVLEVDDVRSDNVRAGVECKDVSDEGFGLACASGQRGSDWRGRVDGPWRVTMLAI